MGWGIGDRTLQAGVEAAPLAFDIEPIVETIPFDFGLEQEAQGHLAYQLTIGNDPRADCTGRFAFADELEGRDEALDRDEMTGALLDERPSGNLSDDTRDRRAYHGDRFNRGRIVLRDRR